MLTFISPVSVAFYVAALLGFIEEHGLAQDIRVVIGTSIRATSCKVGFGILEIEAVRGTGVPRPRPPPARLGLVHGDKQKLLEVHRKQDQGYHLQGWVWYMANKSCYGYRGNQDQGHLLQSWVW
jgi:hypothetical protein